MRELFKVTPELKRIIEDTCKEYEKEFKRHRKNLIERN